MDKLHDILKQYWGYDSFRSLQEEIMNSVLEGKDTLGLMPTGGGKSLTFQVPTLCMKGICIVVTPLVALMKDQVDNLKQKGIKAVAIHSGMSRQEIIVALENCIFGNYKFLYVSPERLGSELFLSKLQYMNVCILAIDESHCISQWGYDFRPSYLQIAEIRKQLPEIPVLALTATATPEVIEDIQEKLHFKEKNVFKKSFERKNLIYAIRRTEDKLFETIRALNNVPGTAIVYVRSRKKTNEIAKELRNQGISADYFHAGLHPDEKIDKQNKWKSGEYRVIVCTNAFGMGIDKPDVRLVIHYELPNSLEEYFQEAGRAGRDEQKAYALAYCSSRDQGRLKKCIKDEFPSKDFIKDVYEKLAFFFQIGIHSGFQTSHNFSLEQFCSVFKYNMTQVHYALKLLELSGYIEYLEEADKQSRLIFTLKRDELYRFANDPQTENLIRVLLRSYTGLFADYTHIKEELLASRTGLSPHQVYETLKMLSTQQIIHFIPARKVPSIVYTRQREDTKHIIIPSSVYEDRRNRLEARINQMVAYTDSETQCRSKLLLSYFGEKNVQDCGNCDNCLALKKNFGKQELETVATELLKNIPDTGCKMDELLTKLPYYEGKIIEAARYLSDFGKIKLTKDYITLMP